MTDRWGRKWTKARLDHSIRTHNFRLSQTTFEFRNTILDQIRRTVAKNPDLSRAGWLKQAMRYLDPRNKNIWGMVAENTDNIFREAGYIEALRRGLTEHQAMSVARNVLLDYGAIPKIEKERIARAMLFYAFQRQMTMEVVKTLLFRDSRTVTSQIKWVMMQHREAGAWMYEDDYMRSYLWTKLTSAEEGYDDMPLQQSYVRAPAVEVFATIANLSFFVADTLDYHIFSKFADPNPEPWSRAQAEYPIPGIAEGSRRERYWTNHDIAMGLIEGTPWRNEFKSVMKLIVEPWGTRVTQQKQMPAEWIVAFESVGQFDLAVDLFDLRKVHEGPFGEGVDPGDIRAGYPLISTTIDGEKQFKTQYRMASQEGLENFIALEYFTTALGIQRNIRDYTNLGVKMGWFPEGSQVKYMGDGDPVLYAFGLETTRVFKPEAHIMIEINKRILREMREQAKPR